MKTKPHESLLFHQRSCRGLDPADNTETHSPSLTPPLPCQLQPGWGQESK